MAALVLLAGAASAADGLLHQAKEEAKPARPASSSPAPPASASSGATPARPSGAHLHAEGAHASDADDGSWFGDVLVGLGSLFGQVVVLAGPPTIPYQPRDGAALTLRAEGGWVNRDVQRGDAEAELGTPVGVDLGLSCGLLRERFGAGRADHLSLIGSDLGFRLFTSDQASVRLGFGVDCLTDGSLSEWGGHGSCAIGVYPIRPLVLRCDGRAGSIGSARVLQLRATAGVAFRRWEFDGGWRWLRIGGVRLDGPLLGASLSF